MRSAACNGALSSVLCGLFGIAGEWTEWSNYPAPPGWLDCEKSLAVQLFCSRDLPCHSQETLNRLATDARQYDRLVFVVVLQVVDVGSRLELPCALRSRRERLALGNPARRVIRKTTFGPKLAHTASWLNGGNVLFARDEP